MTRTQLEHITFVADAVAHGLVQEGTLLERLAKTTMPEGTMELTKSRIARDFKAGGR